MVVSVRRPGSTSKLVSTWAGPFRIVTVDEMNVYGVQNIVTGEVKDVHVVRLRFYVDKYMDMTVALNEVFQLSKMSCCSKLRGRSTKTPEGRAALKKRDSKPIKDAYVLVTNSSWPQRLARWWVSSRPSRHDAVSSDVES